MMRAVLVGTVVVLCSAVGAASQQSDRNARQERFQLFNECKPMRLIVEEVSQNAQDIGVERDRLNTVAESRLRSARLFDTVARPYLYVHVNVVGLAFGIDVRYLKPVYDPASGHNWYATTWSTGWTGTHGRSGGYIVQSVSEGVDRFLVEYLRVNDEAC